MTASFPVLSLLSPTLFIEHKLEDPKRRRDYKFPKLYFWDETWALNWVNECEIMCCQDRGCVGLQPIWTFKRKKQIFWSYRKSNLALWDVHTSVQTVRRLDYLAFGLNQNSKNNTGRYVRLQICTARNCCRVVLKTLCVAECRILV